VWLAHSGKANTPNWDIANTCKVAGAEKSLLLIEAKAHAAELAGKKGGRNSNQMRRQKLAALRLGDLRDAGRGSGAALAAGAAAAHAQQLHLHRAAGQEARERKADQRDPEERRDCQQQAADQIGGTVHGGAKDLPLMVTAGTGGSRRTGAGWTCRSVGRGGPRPALFPL